MEDTLSLGADNITDKITDDGERFAIEEDMPLLLSQ